MFSIARLSILVAAVLSILATTSTTASAVDLPCQSGSVSPPQGTVRACSPGHLADLLNSDFRGRITIPRDVFWTMKARDGETLRNLPVKTGVEIVGERGYLGTRPTLYMNDGSFQSSLFTVIGNDVKISGIHLVGAKPASQHANRSTYMHGIEVIEDFDQQTGRRVLIEDNEFDSWAGGAVNVWGPEARRVRTPAEWGPTWKRPTPADASLVRVERNYMHDNVMDGGGYGVVVGGGAYVTVEGNVFDNNRHAVAADGFANSGYMARYNYVLEGGTRQGNFYNQHFDVHGVGPEGYGGAAGTFFEVSNNTVRGEQSYYAVKTRPVLMMRGKTEVGFYFNGNVLVHDDLDAAVHLKNGSALNSIGRGEDHKKFNFKPGAGNRYNTDYSTEIGSGDFDADGRKDVFLANGTAWWYSRAGVRPWEFLSRSVKRTGELAFADVDNDGRTDVLSRDAAGRLGYHRGGTGPLTPLTTLPVPISELRSGDFDGDRKTDFFYTRAGQWYAWYGSTRTWTATASSGAKIKDLLFGDFDAVKGTDVVAVMNNQWSYSSASTSAWKRLNMRLTSNFDKAVVGDFDGDGNDDIGVDLGSSWRFSPRGAFPLVTMRSGGSIPALKSLQIGRFDVGRKAVVVGFWNDRLAAWRGIGSGNGFLTRSLQDMR